jgi:Zn-dependent protease with chaperone function
MKYTVRAALAVALLVGFYVVAIGIAVGLIFLVVEAARVGLSGAALAKIGFFVAIIAFGIFKGLFSRRKDSAGPAGVLVSERDQPALWSEVRDLASAVGTRAPDEIRLVPQVNAAVSEDAKLLGLVPGIRRMYIGVPLVLGLSRQEVRSVLAHELGHYSGKHTALGPVTYRGKEAIARVLGEIGPKSMVGRLLGLYARLYYAVSHSVSRRQELEADEFSSRLAGRDAAASALQGLLPLDAAWDHFVDSYASLGQDTGRRPAGVFHGFQSLLGDPATREQLAKIRDEQPEPPSSVHDSHPPISQRVSKISSMTDDGVVDDGTPGTSLFDDPFGAFAALEQDIFDGSGLEPTDWDVLVTDTMTSRVERGATALGVQAQKSGAPATLRTAVEGLGRTGSTGLLEASSVDEEREVVARLLADAAANSLVRDGAASFALTWNGGLAELRTADGQKIDPWAPAFEAVADASTEAFVSWASAHGVDLDRELPAAEAGSDEPQPPAEDAVVGGISQVLGSGGVRVLLVTHRGLILRKVDGRDRWMLARYAYFGGAGARLAKRAAERPVDELLADHRSTFIPWARIARLEVHPGTIKATRVVMTFQDGDTRTVKIPSEAGMVGQPWEAMVHYLGERYEFMEK